MTKIQKIIIAVLSVFALGLLISIGYESTLAYQSWASHPLGASIPTSPYTPIPLPPNMDRIALLVAVYYPWKRNNDSAGNAARAATMRRAQE